MLYHPQVHLLVTAGGLSADGSQWLRPGNPAFLVPVRALSIIFRAKMCAALKKMGLLDQLPRGIWKKSWVVHCQPAGSGAKVLDYPGRYVFRVAITNSRLEEIEHGQVTFRYRDNRSQEMRRITLPAEEFIRRFLLHVLPRGCAKVRYYGIWSGSCRKRLDQAKALLNAAPSTADVDSLPETSVTQWPSYRTDRCPYCKTGSLISIEVLYPQRRGPPC
jgi:hypothetical protein